MGVNVFLELKLKKLKVYIFRMSIKRYTVFPYTLYRFQNTIRPKLREYSQQQKLGKSIYDYKEREDKLYHPMEESLDSNGLKMFRMGIDLLDLLDHIRERRVYIFEKGL